MVKLCTLYLLACQVRVIVGDVGLCCWVRVTSLQISAGLREKSERRKACEAQFSRSQVWQAAQFTRPISETTTSEEKGEPKRGMELTSSAHQPDALPLGLTPYLWARSAQVEGSEVG